MQTIEAKREPASTARRPGQASHDRLLRQTQAAMGRLVQEYATTDRGARDFIRRLDELLETRHARAAVQGRQRAGDPGAANVMDAIFAQQVMNGERFHLADFRTALLSGRYQNADGVNVAAIQRRAEMYMGRLTGTANQAFALASPEDALFTWVMGGAEQHCGDCPEEAAKGPRPLSEFTRLPRTNGTQCLYRCRCFLRRSDATEGFRGNEQ